MRIKFNNADDLNNRIEEFYSHCKLNDKPITVTRLCIFLGINRLTLLRYRNSNDMEWLNTIDDEERIKIKDILDNAVDTIECNYEDLLYNRNSFQGSKFSLINNFNWKDKQEIESNNINSIDLSGVSLEDLKKLVEE